jgi:hypothetical protein
MITKLAMALSSLVVSLAAERTGATISDGDAAQMIVRLSQD